MGNFGARFRKCRKDADLKQTKAAELIGISQPTLSQYETDVYEPKVSELLKMCEVYNVSIEYLLGVSDVNESN